MRSIRCRPGPVTGASWPPAAQPLVNRLSQNQLCLGEDAGHSRGEHGWPRQPDQGDLDGMDLGPDPSVRCHSDRGVGHLRTVSATAASRALACSTDLKFFGLD